MNFDQVPAGAAIFLDANTLVYHCTNHPQYGAVSTRLVRLIEQGALVGFTSTDVLADVAHRVMTLEAVALNGWPYAGIAAWLRKHHYLIPKLTVFRQAIASLPKLNIQVIPITQTLLEAATVASHQFELLTGDALVVAVMQAHNLTHLASNDADFDRIPWLTRYEPRP
jgi:predicted nucleic acid-binding protein